MHFIFNGAKSYDMGVYKVEVDSTVHSRKVLGSRTVNYMDKRGRKTPLNYSLDYERITFEVTMLFGNPNGDPVRPTSEMRSKVLGWLYSDEFEELVFTDNPEVVYYAIATEIGELQSYGNGALCTITFETHSPNGWTKESVDQFNIDKKDRIEIMNPSNIYPMYYPTVVISAKEAGDVVITNYSDKGKKTELKKMRKNEVIVIDNENKIIYSELEGENAFAKFNRGWIGFRKGLNILEVEGNVELTIIAQYPIGV